MEKCLDVDVIRAKIKLKAPLEPKEYAFAILYLDLDPKTYHLGKDKNQQKIDQNEVPKTETGTQQVMDLSSIDKDKN